MDEQKIISKFIAENKNNWKEGRYFYLILKILFELDLPKTQDDGFACMKMLKFTQITTTNGYVIDKSFDNAGTIENIAKVIALVFAEINDDDQWWLANYPAEFAKPEISTIAQGLSWKLLDASLVDSISMSSFGHTFEEIEAYNQRHSESPELDEILENFKDMWTTEKNEWKIHRLIENDRVVGYSIVTQTEDSVLLISNPHLKALVVKRLIKEGIKVEDLDLGKSNINEITRLE